MILRARIVAIGFALALGAAFAVTMPMPSG